MMHISGIYIFCKVRHICINYLKVSFFFKTFISVNLCHLKCTTKIIRHNFPLGIWIQKYLFVLEVFDKHLLYRATCILRQLIWMHSRQHYTEGTKSHLDYTLPQRLAQGLNVKSYGLICNNFMYFISFSLFCAYRGIIQLYYSAPLLFQK